MSSVLSQYLEWSKNSEYIVCANIKKAIIQVYSIYYPEWRFKLIEGSAGLESISWSPDSGHILTFSDFNVSKYTILTLIYIIIKIIGLDSDINMVLGNFECNSYSKCKIL